MSGELCALWFGLVSLATVCLVRLLPSLAPSSAVEGAIPSRPFLSDPSPLNFEVSAASPGGAMPHSSGLPSDGSTLRLHPLQGECVPRTFFSVQEIPRDLPWPFVARWKTFRRIAMRSRVFIGFEAILVAYDGSPQSQHALQIAFSLAKMASSKVLIFSVVRIPKPAPRAELNAVLDEGREEYERSFAAIREQAKENEIELETEVAVGNPADQIIHRAETFQASLIVMGRRDKSAVQHWIGGSSSQRVLRYTRCPVMLVR